MKTYPDSSRLGGNAQVAISPPKPSVQRSIDGLEKEIDQLYSIITTLGNRLEPVLTCEAPVPPEKDNAPLTVCVIETSIVEATRKLHCLGCNVSRLIDRLQI